MMIDGLWWPGRSVTHHADGCAPSPSGSRSRCRLRIAFGL